MITTRQNWLGTDARSARRTACLLGLVACGVFLPAVWCGFVDWDDAAYVVENPLVMGGLSATGIRDACTRVVFGFWAPLTILSYQLDASLYGMKPWGFHLTNVLLHAASTGLLYLALLSLTGAPRRCAAVVLLFALHPLRTESVVWIAERKDVLSMVFLTLALVAYARYCRQPSVARFGGVFLAMLAGCLAKSSLVTLPALLLLLDLWPLARAASPFTPRNPGATDRSWAEFLSSWWPLLVEKLPLFGLSAVFAAITLLTHAYALDTSVAARPAAERVGHSLNSIAWYLLHTLWPTGLHPMHHHFEPMLSPAAVAVASLTVVVPIAIALFRPAARPAVVVGLGWFLVALLPTLGILGRVGVAPYADRFTYIPHIGLMLAVVWSVAALTEDAGKAASQWASAAAAALLVLLCTFIVIDESQIRIWRNSETLFQHTVAAESGNFMAHFQYGETLRRRGDLPKAMAEFRLSLQAMEGRRVNATKRSAVHNALGVALRDGGREAEADQEFARAVKLDPTNRLARLNIGVALVKGGRPAEALEQFAALVEADPTDPDALQNLVVTHAILGNLAESLTACRQLVALQPRRADRRARLAHLLLMADDPQAALSELRIAAQLDPRYPGINALMAQAREAAAVKRNDRAEEQRPAGGLPPRQ